MGHAFKKPLAFCVAAALLFLPLSPVFAEGQSRAVQADSAAMRDSDAPETADTASGWAELAAWMKAHADTGGTLRLTAPIDFSGDYATLIRNPGAPPATLLLGEFGLTVSGNLDIYCPGLTILGQGGETASLRALPGGSLGLGYMDAQPGANGAVIWQDEGSILSLEQPITDAAVHFAARPVAAATVTQPQTCLVASNEDAIEKLPQTAQARVYFEGDAEIAELPVIWEVDGEETAESIFERRRTLVFGAFSGVDTFGTLSRQLVFLDRPISFTYVEAQTAKNMRLIEAEFTCPSLPATLQAEYSFDAELWSTAERLEIAQASEQIVTLMFYQPDAAAQEDLIWDTAQNKTLYLRMRWLDAQNDADTYSDVLAIDGDTMQVSSDIGGNRGGGTGAVPPGTLPPPAGGDAVSPPTTSEPAAAGGSHSDTADPAERKPLIGEKNPLPLTENSAVEAAVKKAADAARQPMHPPDKQPELLPDDHSADTPAAEAALDTAVTPPSKPAAASGTEASPQEPMQAVSVTASPETKPPLPKKAAGEIAVGVAAISVITAGSLTWRRWSTPLAALFKRLLHL